MSAEAPAPVRNLLHRPLHLPLPMPSRIEHGRTAGTEIPCACSAGSNHTLFPTARKEAGNRAAFLRAMRAAVRRVFNRPARSRAVWRAATPWRDSRAKSRSNRPPRLVRTAHLSYSCHDRGGKCRDSQWSLHEIRPFEVLREPCSASLLRRCPPCLPPRSRTARCKRRMAHGRSSAIRRPARPPSNAS